MSRDLRSVWEGKTTSATKVSGGHGRCTLGALATATGADGPNSPASRFNTHDNEGVSFMLSHIIAHEGISMGKQQEAKKLQGTELLQYGKLL